MRLRIALLCVLTVMGGACGGTVDDGDGSDTPVAEPGDDVGGEEPDRDDGDGPDADEPDPDDPDPGSDLPDGDGSSPDGDGDDAAGGTYPALPTIREVQDGVRDARERGFEEARYDGTDETLYVLYTTGIEPCAVLADIEVEEHDDRIEVTLHEGYLPEDGEAPVCIEIAEPAAAEVPLERPFDGRAVIDATTGEEVPVTEIDADDAARS